MTTGRDNSTRPKTGLSKRTLAVLEMIAEGHTYQQILDEHPGLTYRDIFDSAEEVLTKLAQPGGGEVLSAMERAKEKHARAYEKWTEEEEDELRRMVESGLTVARIAGKLKRQRSAVRSRIIRLGIYEKLNEKEQVRFQNANRQEKGKGGDA